MKFDRYTKVVLTVIALSLLWLCVRGTPPVASAAATAAVPKVVRAQRFELVDKNGNPRMVVDFWNKGGAGIILYDKNGKDRVELGLGENESPILVFRQNDEKERAALTLDKSGRPVFGLLDKAGKERALFVLTDDGTPILGMRDAKGKERLDLSVEGLGNPGIFLRDQTEKTRASFTVAGEDDFPSLSLFGRDGKCLARLYSSLIDGSGKLALYDKDGNFCWSAPPALERQPIPVLTRPLPSFPFFPRLSTSQYADIGGNHWIEQVISDGSYIKLEDGSLWEISELDRIDTALWLPISDITVVEGENPLYPYKLINTDDGESVEAKLIHQ